MSEPSLGGPNAGAVRKAAGPGLSDWLGLAAAPTFAMMALLAAVSGGGRMAMMCGRDPSILNGMVPMYLLMSVFHSPPWLKRLARRSNARQP